MGRHLGRTIALLGLLALLCARTGGAGDTLPLEVKKLVDRRAECHHWAGEEAYDKARARQIDTAMNRLKCDDIEKEVGNMRAKYLKYAAVKAALPDSIE
jgi:hypothetical protein